MNAINLNLARKWRSKNFDQIVGQDLSVKMLKNSLYRDSYFPVYLFSGQRGCGKTSLARVFAASINCSALPNFQKNPTMQSLPCLHCNSCQAMAMGAHSDFIEIDAASHTGVDMIRQVIDASNLLPLMGHKKVYLIDEAHMLSKASFNALLKVLEEPSASVLFILATTDVQKIIDTVRSRCFQLFFKSIDMTALLLHVQEICRQEKIVYELDALRLIVDESQGSARDALNLLEQVRFAQDVVTAHAVLSTLGRLSDEVVVTLFEMVLTKSPAALLRFLQQHEVHRCAMELLYRRFTDITRSTLWLKYGVVPNLFKEQQAIHMMCVRVADHCTIKQLYDALEALCTNESMFNKTMAKYQLFEMILLQINQKNSGFDDAGGTPVASCVPRQVLETVDENIGSQESDEPEHGSVQSSDVLSSSLPHQPDDVHLWQAFIAQIATLQDPVVLSVFSQAVFVSRVNTIIHVELSRDLHFFKDWLDKTLVLWTPLLEKIFGQNMQVEFAFTRDHASKVGPLNKSKISQSMLEKSVGDISSSISSSPSIQVEYHTSTKSAPAFVRSARAMRTQGGHLTFDISDAQRWEKTHMILQYFPGIVTELKEQGI